MTFGFEESGGYRWRCNGLQLNGVRLCNGSRIPLVKDTVFAYKNTPIHDTFSILYFWLVGTKMGQMETLSGCSAKTVRAVVKSIQRMLQQDLDEQSDCCIGGLDAQGNPIVVEIDESKFGKRKHNRGHRVDGVWVVGGVEKTAERKMFLTTVEKRNKPVLERVISRFVKPGSIVRTDCWAAYNGLSLLDIQIVHQTVNHSEGFNINGIHTNTIEGSWNGIKQKLPARKRTKTDMPWNLVEFIWRRKHLGDLSF
ncbi:hypothetical protein INT47_003732 [Mucor saturninus]|uniref:ISXO2-like transposase domain-containing protein n=1 Tax=Mucor saturninus TaxID=64648 RepID=A0A8H7RAB3_9FUNG|nr:hypothetical protein INT47_003732 [Mucor saturninus]